MARSFKLPFLLVLPLAPNSTAHSPWQGGIQLRLPYQSDPETPKWIHAGEMDSMDIHLSHVAQFVEYGSSASWTSR